MTAHASLVRTQSTCGARRNRVVLKCQPLEDRSMPAVFTVTTLDDVLGSPLYTLRDAIRAANNAGGANDIQFAPGLSGTIYLGSVLPPISADLTIDGRNVISVSRSEMTGPTPGEPPQPPQPTPPFRIFEITAGNTVTFQDLNFTGGYAEGSGGGILNQGTLTLDGVSISECTATGSGGGVENAPTGTLSVTDHCTVQFNTAGGDGGGIDSPGMLRIASSSILSNSAVGAGGGVSCNSVNISDTFIESNHAVGPGGGVLIVDCPAAAMTNDFVTNNASAEDRGGGIFENATSFTIAGGAISNNTASGSGGGLYANHNSAVQATGVSFYGNRTDADGGGVAMVPSELQTMKFTNCSFSNNWTTNWLSGAGGGVYMAGDGSGQLVMEMCSFQSNIAALGGGLYTWCKTDLAGCDFQGNQASVAGGGILGGWADLRLLLYFSPLGTYSNTFSGNQAPEGMGPGIGWVVSGGGTLSIAFNAYAGPDIIDYID